MNGRGQDERFFFLSAYVAQEDNLIPTNTALGPAVELLPPYMPIRDPQTYCAAAYGTNREHPIISSHVN